nr:hypothetical protein [Tanacetum cinerariifolium]
MKTFEDYCSDIQYAVSIKEDMIYLCLHFTKDHEGNKTIRRMTLHHSNNVFDCTVEVKRMGVNILKSIDEGPFQMGTFRETLAEGNECALHLGQGNNARGAGVAGNRGAQNRVGNANPEYFKYKMLLMQAQENGMALDEEQLLFIAGG